MYLKIGFIDSLDKTPLENVPTLISRSSRFDELTVMVDGEDVFWRPIFMSYLKAHNSRWSDGITSILFRPEVTIMEPYVCLSVVVNGEILKAHHGIVMEFTRNLARDCSIFLAGFEDSLLTPPSYEGKRLHPSKTA